MAKKGARHPSVAIGVDQAEPPEEMDWDEERGITEPRPRMDGGFGVMHK